MYWRILPHVTACIAEGRLIFLDIARDRYSQVPEPLHSSVEGWLLAGTGAAPDAVVALMTRSGMIRDGDPAPVNTSTERVRIPAHLFSPIWLQHEPRDSRMSVASSVIATWFAIRTRPLSAILQDHRHFDPPGRRPSEQDVHESCARFDRGRRFSPIARRCLLDTLALDSWLSDLGRSCQIVFGVTAAPFRAHCWLQSPTAVLNDSYDHVSRYTPILAL